MSLNKQLTYLIHIWSDKTVKGTLNRASSSLHGGSLEIRLTVPLIWLFQGWFHGHGVYSTIDGMKYEGNFIVYVIQVQNSLTYSLQINLSTLSWYFCLIQGWKWVEGGGGLWKGSVKCDICHLVQLFKIKTSNLGTAISLNKKNTLGKCKKIILTKITICFALGVTRNNANSPYKLFPLLDVQGNSEE